MHKILFVAIVSVSCAASSLAAQPDSQRAVTIDSARPTVAVSGGRIQGRALSAGGAVFKGIPFAAPPTGDLRWREPAPVKPWKGVLDAAEFGSSCMQGNAAGKEDCLQLNVWTPSWPAGKKMPVMFWIYGGSNVAGSASADYMNGAALSRKGVVVVSSSYRLGVFGFLAHPALTAESPHHASSNYGLLDLVAALRWVRQNISRFGGDPDNVTIFGQSAGSVSVGFLMTSPPARGLFHRAIQESGPIIREMTTLRDAEHAGEELAADLHAPPGAAAIKYLRTLPAEQIQRAFATKRAPVAPALSIIDGWVIPSDPAKIFAEGGEFALPVLLGTNAQEMPGPDSGTIRSEIAAAYGANADKAIAYYGLNGSPEGNIDPLYGSASFQFSADVRQRCALIQEAVWHSARYPVYHYQLDHPIPGQPATHHSSELPYVFGNFPITGNLGGPYTSSDRALSDLMQSYWTNFARQGDPNGAGLQHWPRFDPKQRAFMEFTDGGPVASSGLRRDICELLMQTARQRKGIADAMGGQ